MDTSKLTEKLNFYTDLKKKVSMNFNEKDIIDPDWVENNYIEASRLLNDLIDSFIDAGSSYLDLLRMYIPMNNMMTALNKENKKILKQTK